MTHDIHTLILWIRIVDLIASVCATSLPVLYATLFPWRSRMIGKLFMMLAVTLAMAIDLSTLFSFWRPADILVRFWISAVVITLIAVSTLLLSIFMTRLRFPSKKVGKAREVQ